jgi:hypothetical protein
MPTPKATATQRPTTQMSPTNSPTPPIKTLKSTSTPTKILTPTPKSLPTEITDFNCDKAQVVKEVNVPDKSLLSPGEDFIKTWKIKNIGSCTWTLQYSVSFLSGNIMNGLTSRNIPNTVEPNGTIDISLYLRAPENAGYYTSNWVFQNPEGVTVILLNAQITVK